MDNPGRGAGRTFAACHTVAGMLETTKAAGVVCLVQKYDRVVDIMRMMVFRAFPDHSIKFHRTVHSNFFMFTLPDGEVKNIKFVTLERAQDEFLSNAWPVIEFTEYQNKRKGADNWENRVPLM
jgi:hypothetical protein